MERALPDTVVIDPGGFYSTPHPIEKKLNVELNDVENKLIDGYVRELRFKESLWSSKKAHEDQ